MSHQVTATPTNVKPLPKSEFERWTVLGFAEIRNRQAYWLCECKCGTVRKVRGDQLRRGISESCGCLQIEHTVAARTTHGLASKDNLHPLYPCWVQMRERCINPKNKHYPDYGGRGITVCKRWMDFGKFVEDMGPKPSPKHSMDRFPDNNGNYEPGNVRWATGIEQANNTRKNVFIAFQGKTLTASQWSRELGIPKKKILRRFRKGLPTDQIFSIQNQPTRHAA